MSEQQLTRDSVPFLPRGVMMKEDEVRNRTVLLAPERTLALDGTGIAIVGMIDGERSVAEIVATLAEQYNAPLQTIGNDVVAFMRDLLNRGYLDISDGN